MNFEVSVFVEVFEDGERVLKITPEDGLEIDDLQGFLERHPEKVEEVWEVAWNVLKLYDVMLLASEKAFGDDDGP